MSTLEGVMTGRAERLAQVYADHVRPVTRLAYLITGDAQLAEDLAQEAFVRLSGRLLTLRDPNAVPAYLNRTVINLCNQHFRRQKVARRYLEREKATARTPHVDPPEVTRDDVLWAAMDRLSARQRTAIVLRFYQDLSEQQTADLLGCAVGTVKSLVARGMQVLRAELQGAKR